MGRAKTQRARAGGWLGKSIIQSLKDAPVPGVPLLAGKRCIIGHIVIAWDNLAILACGRLRCAPLGGSSGTHQATWSAAITAALLQSKRSGDNPSRSFRCRS